MNAEHWRKFIDSLEGEKGLSDGKLINEFEWVETGPLINVGSWLNQTHNASDYYRVIERLLNRCRRAESRQIPDLKEKVKAFSRAFVEAERAYADSPDNADKEMTARKFRALCAPEKDSKEVK